MARTTTKAFIIHRLYARFAVDQTRSVRRIKAGGSRRRTSGWQTRNNCHTYDFLPTSQHTTRHFKIRFRQCRVDVRVWKKNSSKYVFFFNVFEFTFVVSVGHEVARVFFYSRREIATRSMLEKQIFFHLHSKLCGNELDMTSKVGIL